MRGRRARRAISSALLERGRGDGVSQPRRRDSRPTNDSVDASARRTRALQSPLKRWNARTHGQAAGAIIAVIMPSHIAVSASKRRRPSRVRASCPTITSPIRSPGSRPSRAQSKFENSPCDPVVVHDDDAVVVVGVAEREHLPRRVDLVEDVLEDHGLRFDRGRGSASRSSSGDRRSTRVWSAPSSAISIGRNSVGCCVATKRGQLRPRAADTAREDGLDRAPLRGRRGGVDDERLRPLAVDHPLRRVEGDDGLHAGERDIAEGALVEAKRPSNPCSARACTTD